MRAWTLLNQLSFFKAGLLNMKASTLLNQLSFLYKLSEQITHGKGAFIHSTESDKWKGCRCNGSWSVCLFTYSLFNDTICM
jgi:hypothetical protein